MRFFKLNLDAARVVRAVVAARAVVWDGGEVERLERREGLGDGAQVRGRAGEVEVAREREREVAQAREGARTEEGVHEVREGHLDGVCHARDAVYHATPLGRQAPVRRGYGQAGEGGVFASGRFGESAEALGGALRERGGWVAVRPAG